MFYKLLPKKPDDVTEYKLLYARQLIQYYFNDGLITNIFTFHNYCIKHKTKLYWMVVGIPSDVIYLSKIKS